MPTRCMCTHQVRLLISSGSCCLEQYGPRLYVESWMPIGKPPPKVTSSEKINKGVQTSEVLGASAVCSVYLRESITESDGISYCNSDKSCKYKKEITEMRTFPSHSSSFHGLRMRTALSDRNSFLWRPSAPKIKISALRLQSVIFHLHGGTGNRVGLKYQPL